MYYLAKFCRICIKTGVKLMDIETPDFDSVKLSEKLEICMEMVITRESLSTEICLQCIKKLRISYDFKKMCKQSSKILQGYLTELISTSNKISPDSFVNSELRVTLTPLCKKFKRKRITKEKRCSLLKKLLLSTNKACKLESKDEQQVHKGGLKSIINFTKNYDFGYKVDDNVQNFEVTPLNRLTTFTDNFFNNNFSEFRDTILYIIENRESYYESDTDEEMFQNVAPDEVKCEELIIEPDIKVKSELDDCDDEYPNNYEENEYVDQFSECFTNSSVQMLDQLVEKLSCQRRTFSQYNVKCRTRGNPYINPHLKQQFQMRSFQCDQCNRYFKSPGYLKAHISKIHS